MKKTLRVLLALALALCLTPAALAETVIDGQADRNITLQEVGLNEVIDGVSPTTGLTLSELDQPEGFAGLAITGRYMPMLVQIDNTDGGVGDRAPWRQEWDAGFLYYGGQTRKGSNIEERFREYGVTSRDVQVLFSGIVGNNRPWKQYYTRVSGVVSPHNVDANVAAMYELIDPSFTPPNHAFLFTDELPATGESAEVITIDWGAAMYNSRFIYDVDSNQYFRYMLQKDGTEVAYEDKYTQEQLAFSNLIVQHTTVTWNGSSDAPVTVHIGEGNADIFMGGKYIAGYWKRADANSRTVFYDAEGNEIALQRGKTFISIIPAETTVSYE